MAKMPVTPLHEERQKNRKDQAHYALYDLWLREIPRLLAEGKRGRWALVAAGKVQDDYKSESAAIAAARVAGIDNYIVQPITDEEEHWSQNELDVDDS
ncbi:hypothetical protein [Endothiovibrio diazotrophicus]